MKVKNVLLAALVASAVEVSENELHEAYNAFVQDFKQENLVNK